MLTAAGGVALWLFLKARALTKLVFFPGTVSGIALDGVSPVLTVSIMVQNPSSVGVAIESLAGNVFANDGTGSTLIGNVSNFQGLIIAPNATSYLVIAIRMRLVGVVNEIVTAFQTGNYTKNLDFQCVVNVHGVQMPLNFQIAVGA